MWEQQPGPNFDRLPWYSEWYTTSRPLRPSVALARYGREFQRSRQKSRHLQYLGMSYPDIPRFIARAEAARATLARRPFRPFRRRRQDEDSEDRSNKGQQRSTGSSAISEIIDRVAVVVFDVVQLAKS